MDARTSPDIRPGYSTPPYSGTQPLPPAAPRLPRGTVIVLDLSAEAEDWAALDQTVLAVRRRFSAAPVILRVPRVTAATMRLAHHAAQLRARAVVGADEPLGDALRPVLTRPHDLGDDVAEWIQLRGRHLSPAVEALVRRVVGSAHRFSQLADLLAPLGEPARTARQRFRAEHLPPPSTWHQMARALNHALRIQARPEARLTLLAMEAGYSDHSGLTRQLIRMFGVTPVAIRGTLGWEWLADRWLIHARDSSGNPYPLQSLS